MENNIQTINPDGIVLLAKLPGLTSFKSLNSVKKSLNTKKVGHTGTLDSFAQGLLVVCTGRLTRLAGNIIEFDKSYKAVISFGEETDSLEYTGNIVKKTALPLREDLEKAVKKYTGKLLQSPPVFSAVHVDGRRASDIVRNGETIELPKRPVEVYSADIEEILENSEGRVEACLINFSVSKGTYIRCLARDIAAECGSSGYLSGLYRTKVGNFCIEDAAGFSLIKPFTIERCLEEEKAFKSVYKAGEFVLPPFNKDEDDLIKSEIITKMQKMSPEISQECGFGNICLVSGEALSLFQNGQPLRSKMFTTSLHEIPNNSITSVFAPDGNFTGLINKNEEGRVSYKFVIN